MLNPLQKELATSPKAGLSLGGNSTRESEAAARSRAFEEMLREFALGTGAFRSQALRPLTSNLRGSDQWSERSNKAEMQGFTRASTQEIKSGRQAQSGDLATRMIKRSSDVAVAHDAKEKATLAGKDKFVSEQKVSSAVSQNELQVRGVTERNLQGARVLKEMKSKGSEVQGSKTKVGELQMAQVAKLKMSTSRKEEQAVSKSSLSTVLTPAEADSETKSLKAELPRSNAEIAPKLDTESASEWLQERIQRLGQKASNLKITVLPVKSGDGSFPEVEGNMKSPSASLALRFDDGKEGGRGHAQKFGDMHTQASKLHWDREASPSSTAREFDPREQPAPQKLSSRLHDPSQTAEVRSLHSTQSAREWAGRFLKGDNKETKTTAREKSKASGPAATLSSREDKSDREGGSTVSKARDHGSKMAHLKEETESKGSGPKAQATLESRLNHVPVSGSGNGQEMAPVNGKLLSSNFIDRAQLPEMIQKIVEMANSQSSQANHKIEVQLDIERVGNLLVDAVKQQDKINLQVSVENSEVRRLLEAQIRPMLDQMAKGGIEVGSLEVFVRDSKDGGLQNEDARTSQQALSEGSRKPEVGTDASEKPSSGYVAQRNFGYNSLEIWA